MLNCHVCKINTCTTSYKICRYVDGLSCYQIPYPINIIIWNNQYGFYVGSSYTLHTETTQIQAAHFPESRHHMDCLGNVLMEDKLTAELLLLVQNWKIWIWHLSTRFSWKSVTGSCVIAMRLTYIHTRQLITYLN